MALGLGDMTLPALPPPIMASRDGRLGEIGTAGDGERYGGDRDDGHVHEDTDRGQDQGHKGQGQQSAVSPSFLTMVSAMVVAAPDSIRRPPAHRPPGSASPPW